MGERLLWLPTVDCARVVVGRNPQVDQVIFRAYKYIPNQSSKDDPRFLIGRDHFLNGFNPEVLLKGLEDGTNIALDSTVITGNNHKFLLMVDLAPSRSRENQSKIGDRLRQLIVPEFGGGFLIATGRSYHYLGFELVEDIERWHDFNYQCLITSIVHKTPSDQPNIHELVVDYRYIGHSGRRRSTGLRVTTKGEKTFEPKSVAII